MDYKEKYEYWQTSDVVDAQTKQELEALKANDGEIQDARRCGS